MPCVNNYFWNWTGRWQRHLCLELLISHNTQHDASLTLAARTVWCFQRRCEQLFSPPYPHNGAYCPLPAHRYPHLWPELLMWEGLGNSPLFFPLQLFPSLFLKLCCTHPWNSENLLALIFCKWICHIWKSLSFFLNSIGRFWLMHCHQTSKTCLHRIRSLSKVIDWARVGFGSDSPKDSLSLSLSMASCCSVDQVGTPLICPPVWHSPENPHECLSWDLHCFPQAKFKIQVVSVISKMLPLNVCVFNLCHNGCVRWQKQHSSSYKPPPSGCDNICHRGTPSATEGKYASAQCFAVHLLQGL